MVLQSAELAPSGVSREGEKKKRENREKREEREREIKRERE